MAWASCGELQGFPENTTDSQNINKNIPELQRDVEKNKNEHGLLNVLLTGVFF